MRTTLILAMTLILILSGCSTPSKTKIQPAPAPFRDNKTPVSLSKPVLSQRIQAQRIQDAQVAQGDLAVEGQRR